MSAPEVKEGLLVSVLEPLITTQRRSGCDAKDVKVEVSFAIALRLKLLSRLGFESVTVATTPSPPAGVRSIEQRTSASLSSLVFSPEEEVDVALVRGDMDARYCGFPCSGRKDWAVKDDICLK